MVMAVGGGVRAEEAGHEGLGPGVGVVAMVPDQWGHMWQPRHHVLSRLARRSPVVWLSPARGWREALRGGLRAPSPASTAPPGLEVDQLGWTLPVVHRPRFVGDLLLWLRLRLARRRLRRRGCRRYVLYLWRPAFARAADLLKWDAVIYHVDDEYTFDPSHEGMHPREMDLLERADLVVIHSDVLWERKARFTRRAVRAPNGVDFEQFARLVPEPPDLHPIPGPRIGYVGWIKEQLDWSLIEALVERHPEWQWVFVGGVKGDPDLQRTVAALERRSNFHLLGAKPSAELGAYMQHVDVAIMPYLLNLYTRNIYPMKLHEYLAAGRSVVTTPVPAACTHGDVIMLATTVDQWSTAIHDALSPAARTPEQVERRRAVARQHDWDTIVSTLSSAMRDVLDESGGTSRDRTGHGG